MARLEELQGSEHKAVRVRIYKKIGRLKAALNNEEVDEDDYEDADECR